MDDNNNAIENENIEALDVPTVREDFFQEAQAIMAEAITPADSTKDDCDCELTSSTSWHPTMGMTTTQAYVDQDGRRWGYDATCGGQVQA